MIYISFAMIAFIIAVDQLTKQLVLNVVGLGGTPVSVIDGFFYITCHRNSGAAWGLFKDGRVFFVIMTTVVLIVMFCLLFRIKNRFFRVALSFVIGGAIGNYLDRLLVGSVVDFLDFYIFGYNFPTFNAADSSIVLGVALLAVYYLRAEAQKDGRGV